MYKYFQPSSADLPSPEEVGLGEAAAPFEKSSVAAHGRKRKRYTAFTDEERARIGHYAAENGNSAALKKFRPDVPDLGKSS